MFVFHLALRDRRSQVRLNYGNLAFKRQRERIRNFSEICISNNKTFYDPRGRLADLENRDYGHGDPSR
jgi:hypothetical protein